MEQSSHFTSVGMAKDLTTDVEVEKEDSALHVGVGLQEGVPDSIWESAIWCASQCSCTTLMPYLSTMCVKHNTTSSFLESLARRDGDAVETAGEERTVRSLEQIEGADC